MNCFAAETLALGPVFRRGKKFALALSERGAIRISYYSLSLTTLTCGTS
jgi:hypothetical protein